VLTFAALPKEMARSMWWVMLQAKGRLVEKNVRPA